MASCDEEAQLDQLRKLQGQNLKLQASAAGRGWGVLPKVPRCPLVGGSLVGGQNLGVLFEVFCFSLPKERELLGAPPFWRFSEFGW